MDFFFDCSTPFFLRQFLNVPRAIWSTPLAGHWALGTQSLQPCTTVAGVVMAWFFYMDSGDNLDPHFCVTRTAYVSHSLCSQILVLSSCLTVYVSLPEPCCLDQRDHEPSEIHLHLPPILGLQSCAIFKNLLLLYFFI